MHLKIEKCKIKVSKSNTLIYDSNQLLRSLYLEESLDVYKKC